MNMTEFEMNLAGEFAHLVSKHVEWLDGVVFLRIATRAANLYFDEPLHDLGLEDKVFNENEEKLAADVSSLVVKHAINLDGKTLLKVAIHITEAYFDDVPDDSGLHARIFTDSENKERLEEGFLWLVAKHAGWLDGETFLEVATRVAEGFFDDMPDNSQRLAEILEAELAEI